MGRRIEEVTSALLAEFTPLQLAALLPGKDGAPGIDDAHIYRARRGDYTPTYVDALRAAGHLPPLPDYPYFKIRSDDPGRAARQVLRSLGIIYARALAHALLASAFGAGPGMEDGQMADKVWPSCERSGSSALQCSGPLYRTFTGVVQCQRHIVAQRVWQRSGAAWALDLVDWEAQLQPAHVQRLDNATTYIDHHLWNLVTEDDL